MNGVFIQSGTQNDTYNAGAVIHSIDPGANLVVFEFFAIYVGAMLLALTFAPGNS